MRRGCRISCRAPQFVSNLNTNITVSASVTIRRMPAPTNTQFSLAVHMLTLLGSQAPELVRSDFLSASAGTSPEHVRRVLAPLRRAGLVRSRPGPSGGWQLDRAGCDTTLGDIWRAVHGDDGVLGLHSAAP